MKSLFAAFVLVMLAAPAVAQENLRWTAPSGAWSIDHVSQGWTHANPIPPELAHFARIMIPLEPPPDDEVRMCAVSEGDIGIADPDAERVRSTAGRLTEAAAVEMFAPRNQRVTSISTSTINGVSVADISTISNNGAMAHLHRIFYLPQNARVTFVEIDCLWAASLDPVKVAEIPAVLSTLAIN
jgi:hypothetical protein